MSDKNDFQLDTAYTHYMDENKNYATELLKLGIEIDIPLDQVNAILTYRFDSALTNTDHD